MHFSEKKVLAITKSQADCELIELMLEDFEAELDTVLIQEVDIQKLNSETYKVILLDIEEYWEKSLSILEGLVGNPNNQNGRVIILAPMSDKEKIVKLIKQGVADYIHKPFGAEKLKLRIMLQFQLSEEKQQNGGRNCPLKVRRWA